MDIWSCRRRRSQAAPTSCPLSSRRAICPLNRNDDYFYSLFVPARASQTFPLFDQPDLKGSLTLALEIPSGWRRLRMVLKRSATRPEIGRRFILRPRQALPTYLFGFAAGKFTVAEGGRNGRKFRMYHRETDCRQSRAEQGRAV